MADCLKVGFGGFSGENDDIFDGIRKISLTKLKITKKPPKTTKNVTNSPFTLSAI